MIKVPLSKILNRDGLAASICKESFFFFVQEFWEVIINEKPVWNWHIKYLCDELQKIGERVKRREPTPYEYYLINVPPGSSKSTIISIMYPMWCWTIDASQRFICSSYASTVSEDLADKSRKIFYSEKYQRYFPSVGVDRENEAKTKFKNKKGGQRYASSTGSAITGIHAHQIIGDDPVNPQLANSETERNNANKYFDETLSTRKVDKLVTPTIIVMQRLHENDPTGHLIDKGVSYFHICLPAELDENISPAHLATNYTDGLLDPVRLPFDAIRKLEVSLGSYGAAGQLQQRPAPAEGGILKKKWFGITDLPVPKGVKVNFKLDTAYTEDQTNDPTGFFAYYMLNNIMYIVNAEDHYLEMPDLVAFIPEYVKRHGYTPSSMIKVEPKASGKSVVQMLKKGKLNIVEGRSPKDSKITRANAISPTCESGKVVLHRGAWNDKFLGQLGGFPNASHDEFVDLLCDAVSEEFLYSESDYKWKRKN